MLITNSDNSNKINNTNRKRARKARKWLHRKDMAKNRRTSVGKSDEIHIQCEILIVINNIKRSMPKIDRFKINEFKVYRS